MKKPNFFIIGGPKCGTTSMAAWLTAHPQIFMPRRKEPHYFNTDFNLFNTRTLTDYELLFEEASDAHLAAGEASTHYLYSMNAVEHILQYCDSPKFIVMIRNPIEMAYSLYGEKVVAGEERVRDFATAWGLQDRRMKEDYKLNHHDPKLFMYGPMCRLGEQLDRLLATVERQHVLTIVLDDLKHHPQREYQRVLAFLGVPDDHRTDFPVQNISKDLRIHIIQQIVYRSRDARVYGRSPKYLNRMVRFINKYNKVNRSRAPLSTEMKDELKRYFKEDISILSKLLQRDFSHWLA